MPVRILHALGRKFDLRPAALPSLRKVQNIVHHFRRTRLGGNDKRKLIVEAVRAAAFSGREGDHDAFTFTNEYEASGVPNVGNGSATKSFLVGMTTKALLRNAARDPGTFVLHLDTTFKLNSLGYPVLVCGITDVSWTFHLVVLFITSQLQEAHLQLRSLRCAAVAKLREKTRGMSSVLSQLVYRGIYDLHFARSEEEFDAEKEVMLKQWAEHPDLTTFTTYVKSQWFYGNFANWQAFLSPSGFAATNNPVEKFNRALKRDYTHHRQLKMEMLVAQLLAFCGHRSMALPRFSLVPTCPVMLQTRTRGLRRRDLLVENAGTRSSIDFILADPELVHVRAVPPMRLFVPELNRAREDMAISAQFGVRYARMEVEGQP